MRWRGPLISAAGRHLNRVLTTTGQAWSGPSDGGHTMRSLAEKSFHGMAVAVLYGAVLGHLLGLIILFLA